ncbi:MAG: PAC2 family protein [Actinomycetales bacterium]|nr:PAC2 family protein [Actinomycetales bacterium]
MGESREFVTLTPAAETLGVVPVLIQATHSPMDAGQAAMLFSEHLVDSLQHERIATFDPDQLINYRQHRPPMVFEDWRFTDYAEPEIALDLLRDDEGTPLLLLHGPEPDLQWNRFTDAVIALADRFGVQITYAVQGIPMGVPHTRPVHLTMHATDRELIGEQPDIFGTIQVPGHVAGLIEYRLGRRGHKAVGITASVPHYLASSPFPPAASALVRRVAQHADLALPVGELEAAAARIRAEIAEQVNTQPEVLALVSALEAQYDSFVRSQPMVAAHAEQDPGDLPTADEIGAAAEAFLADLLGGGTAGPDEPGEPLG